MKNSSDPFFTPINNFALETYAMLIQAGCDIFNLVSLYTASESTRSEMMPALGTMMGLIGAI
jgi:hypothetical protein